MREKDIIEPEIAERAREICSAAHALSKKFKRRRVWLDPAESLMGRKIIGIGCDRSDERQYLKDKRCVLLRPHLFCPAGEEIKEKMVALRPANIV